MAQHLDPACAVPAAVPNDGLDDRAAIQEALTTQGCAYLPAGTYDIDTPSFVPPARRIYAMLTATGARLYGDGPATVLRFRGDAGGQDWQGVRLDGVSPSLHDLSMNTADLTNTNEQTHAVRVVGPTADPTIYKVSFTHPQRGEPGGDCVQLVGYAPAQLITRARIHDNEFGKCDRSGVAIHSGTQDLEIADNRFHDTGDQDIDGEGTGDNSDWLIARNTISLGAAPQGAIAIQIQLTSNVRITENVLQGRGIFAYSCSACEIDHNLILRRAGTSGMGAVEIQKASSHVNVHHNVIERADSAGTGSVVRAYPHGTGTPDHVTISDNVLIQRATAGSVIETMGVVGLFVERNTVTHAGAADTSYGVLANGSAGTNPIRTDDLHVNSNTWSGPLKAVIAISGSYGGCGSLSATHNVAAAPGVLCQNATTGSMILGPLDVSGNTWLPSLCGTMIAPGN
ncbi:right-handed parallel beta-helix repeat-containing protein [Myxococcus sp. RHSTA-1-4]|uniref:right-handed parallel beta-helix repeat-containing protein n=1 Tax=Myxococcus sp. RHSTA-1-4 TaxID=2874601 RepID=UPI001CBFC57B|nr:right-handed parallel beta-helix repeat-containing protein [Myxococcus sp. RHSTA-1-4]MBZ4421110.1 right-handed parallel beta-helix repeat-containing protein [Myxococcus sp. RHSTA-1-4]